MVIYFGAHIPAGKDMLEDIKHLNKMGGNLVQIMLTIKGFPLVSKEKEPFLLKIKEYLIENNMKVVIHSSYTHNLARDWDNHSWWIYSIEHEIKYAHFLGAIGLVIHFGKSLELSLAQAYNNMFTCLVHINNITKKYSDIKIFLETSTGQGTEMCYKLEDLAYFYKKISNSSNKELKERIKICIDTCHIFAAGYNIRTAADIKQYLDEFDELIGLKYVKLIHLNDCKVELGGKIDRHEEVGKGKIGLSGLKIFFDYFAKHNVPIVLETPGCSYGKEIKLMLTDYPKQ